MTAIPRSNKPTTFELYLRPSSCQALDEPFWPVYDWYSVSVCDTFAPRRWDRLLRYAEEARMIDVRAAIEKHLSETRLEILVFGPAIEPASHDPYIASLQRKRQEIRSRLVADGHSAAFGEEVVDPSLPAHLSDPLLQEIVASIHENLWRNVRIGHPSRCLRLSPDNHNLGKGGVDTGRESISLLRECI